MPWATASDQSLARALQRVVASGSHLAEPDLGGRSPARVLARDTRKIQGEDVKVASEDEAAEANDIITRISANYGITIDSGELVKATLATYHRAPRDETMFVKRRRWSLRELRAVERACMYFAPILGTSRAGSTRKDAAQEVVAFGKATTSISKNDPTGYASSGTLGEQYKSHKTAGIYSAIEVDRHFAYRDVDKNLEWICTHELAHGLMEYIARDLRKKARYWKDESNETGHGEKPFSKYGRKGLQEDLAESTAAYFMRRADFAKQCPKRFEVVDAAVKAWPAAPPPPVPGAPDDPEPAPAELQEPAPAGA